MKRLFAYSPTVLPWTLFVLGLMSLLTGSFISEDFPRWSKLLTSIGSSVLASGIFALILKTIQFMGVFKEELNSIIFDTKFLKNRVDLPLYWEKVTKELVKDKFPGIHNLIMKDVKEQYLPTSLIHYYDTFTNIIQIELIDSETKLIEVKHKQTFTIIPGDQNLPFKHNFWNRIICEKNCDKSFCKIGSVKVNDKDVVIEPVKTYEGNSLITKFEIPLDGVKSGYKIEICSTKRYSLDYDNIIGYTNKYIQHNFKVQILLKKVKAKFFECGTLKNFETIHQTDTLIEKEYKGLMYKGQGYLVYLEI